MDPPNSRPEDGAELPRIGVYVCHCGGNISDVVDVRKVAETAGRLPEVAVARENTFMCSDPGQQMIIEDIRKKGLNRVVVAACSPSLHELTFRRTLARAGLNPFLFENVNIREQVSWVSKSDPHGATQKAIRLVAAGVAKARLSRPLEPIRVEAERNVAVIGGGVSGMRCALDLSRRGLQVVLIERSPSLGGRVAGLHRLYPVECSARDTSQRLVWEVSRDDGIEVRTSAEVTEVTGYLGNFTIAGRVHSGGAAPEEFRIQAGAIVLATGFDDYTPWTGEYGYGEFPEALTLSEFIRLLDENGPTGGRLETNGHPVRNVCFIHCVGSRQIEGIHEPGPDGTLHEYCSRFCCTAALQAACEVRRRFPAVNVFDFYRDIRTYGRGHEEYYEEASRRGVVFFRFRAEEPPEVQKLDGRNGSPLRVKVKDTLTWGEEIEAPADIVVLVTGASPRNIRGLIDMLKLARSPDGFLQEVHPKLRPVETAVGGVFVAGGCQAPMDIGESCAAASAAAARASALLLKGYTELEPFIATIDSDLCRGTGACIEECRYQNAISLVETRVNGTIAKVAQVNPALCRGCGMCVPVCPHSAIQVEGCRLDQVEAMVEAIAAGD